VWSPGQRVGDYEIVAKLREGGMATLFLARRTGAAGFSRHVAIKVVHPDLANDEQFRQMFLDEALLSSRIDHPNVVHVEELGQHEGAHFLTMEFVHGCSLSQLQRALLARGRRLAPAFATRIAMHVADGLHAAHETLDDSGRPLNVVHRDVTPENILLAYGGHVKLIDFGIAKAYGRKHRTMDGLLKGKFRYMAPEQAYGKPVDRRVDIYQLGIVLWEMLTLRRLFSAERDVELLASVQKPNVVPPSSLVDRIPPALDAAVMCALSPDPRRRPPDAQSFARMLGKAVPAAHEVDSGALRALLLATMSEHRLRERTTYPPGVYERLEQQVDTQPLAGAEQRARTVTANLEPTYEHTEPWGSDSPGGEAPLGATRQGEQRRRIAKLGLERAKPALRARRPRRLVRLASELRTTLTRIVEAGFVGSRAYWIGIGSVVGLASALLLIALAIDHGPRARPAPPGLPQVAAQGVRSAPPSPRLPQLNVPGVRGGPPPSAGESAKSAQRVTGDDADNAAHGTTGVSAGRGDAGVLRARPAAPRSESGVAGERGGDARKGGDLIVVDETPLITKPGF
jgi:serine/threonine-protein kinase